MAVIDIAVAMCCGIGVGSSNCCGCYFIHRSGLIEKTYDQSISVVTIKMHKI